MNMSSGDAKSGSGAYTKSLVAASLYVDYVFLDTDERRRMAQNPHEYLIEQLQFTGDESVGSSSNKIKLNFNHPCKELLWVVQPDAHVDYCASLRGGNDLYKLMGAQPFNYTDAMDVLPNAVHAFGGPDAIDTFLSGNMLADPGAADITGQANVTNGAGADTHNADGAAPSMHPLLLVVVLSLESLMPELLFSPRLLSTCTAGVSTQL